MLTLTPFHRVSLDDYRVLLRHLLERDQIERTETGGLIVGLAGERVTNNFKFYAVFQENEEYTVRSESQELGTIVQPPPVGERIAIAGHVWVVEEIDHKRHLIEATQVKGKVPAYFGECPGDINTHVLERMRQVLREDRDYPYLHGQRPRTPAAGAPCGSQRAPHRRAAHLPGRQGVVPVAVAGHLRLPGAGALPQDPLRGAAGPEGARHGTPVLHAVHHAGGRDEFFDGAARAGAGVRPHGAGLSRRGATL